MGGVYMVEDTAAIPEAGWTFVSKAGVVRHADGTCEVWQPGTAAASPLSRKTLVTETKSALDSLKKRIEEDFESRKKDQ